MGFGVGALIWGELRTVWPDLEAIPPKSRPQVNPLLHFPKNFSEIIFLKINLFFDENEWEIYVVKYRASEFRGKFLDGIYL